MEHLDGDIRQLLWLTKELESMLVMPRRVSSRGGSAPAAGPRSPVPADDIDFRSEFEDEIRDVVVQVHSCNDQLHSGLVGRPLSVWVAWLLEHQHWLYAHPEPEVIATTIRYWVNRLGRRINPPEVKDLVGRPEPWFTARTIAHRLAGMGHNYSVDNVRVWASRGHFESRLGDDGVTRYRLCDVLDYLDKRGVLRGSG